MSIGKQGARDLITTLKAGTAGKQELRDQLADAVNVLQVKMNALDIQLATAAQSFAESKPAQFNTYLAGLPDVGDVV